MLKLALAASAALLLATPAYAAEVKIGHLVFESVSPIVEPDMDADYCDCQEIAAADVVSPAFLNHFSIENWGGITPGIPSWQFIFGEPLGPLSEFHLSATTTYDLLNRAGRFTYPGLVPPVYASTGL